MVERAWGGVCGCSEHNNNKKICRTTYARVGAAWVGAKPCVGTNFIKAKREITFLTGKAFLLPIESDLRPIFRN